MNLKNLNLKFLKEIVNKHNKDENAWAFTYLPRSPIVQSLCPKVLFSFLRCSKLDMILKPGSLLAPSSRGLLLNTMILLHIMSVTQSQMSHLTSALLLGNENLPDDLDLWPTTLTYNPSLAKVKVNSHTKNQGHRSNGSAVRVLTHRQSERQMERWKDGSDSITSTADAGGKNINFKFSKFTAKFTGLISFIPITDNSKPCKNICYIVLDKFRVP